MNIELINGAHHEWNFWEYLLQEIFPEFNISGRPPWKKQIEPTNKHLIVSANLDCKKLKGYKKDGFDEQFTLPNDYIRSASISNLRW